MSVDAVLFDAFILFSLSLSLVLSVMVTSSIRFDKRCKRSYHMMLVQRLLRANIGMALLIGVYVMNSLLISNRRNDSLCAVGLPVLVYFSLVSTSWTLMLALRFRSNQNISTALNKPPFPLEAIWLIWLVPSIIILVFDFSIGHVSIVLHSGGDYSSSCFFDPSSTHGIVSGLVLYQLPLIFIFVWTVYAYIEGIVALRNAPGTVAVQCSAVVTACSDKALGRCNVIMLRVSCSQADQAGRRTHSSAYHGMGTRHHLPTSTHLQWGAGRLLPPV